MRTGLKRNLPEVRLTLCMTIFDLPLHVKTRTKNSTSAYNATRLESGHVTCQGEREQTERETKNADEKRKKVYYDRVKECGKKRNGDEDITLGIYKIMIINISKQ